MPYYHCNKCHHEFESFPEKRGAECVNPSCDWCGGDSYILEDETPLEKMMNHIDEIGMEKFMDEVESIISKIKSNINNSDESKEPQVEKE